MNEFSVRVHLPRENFDVDIDLRAAGALALTGASGSGKSSVLRAVAGLEPRASGRIVVSDSIWQDDRRSLPAPLRDAGYLGQRDGLFPHLTAAENVAYTLRASGASKLSATAQSLEALDRLGLGEVASARPAALSGGQRRRVALARAIAPRRAIYLLDEPFSGLDSETADVAARFIAETFSAHAAPALIAGHDHFRLRRICARLESIERGKVVQNARPIGSAGRSRAQTAARSPRSSVGTPAGFPGDSR
jgi:ABC-type sulfate/molybdate transport systems ATPase subunit